MFEPHEGTLRLKHRFNKAYKWLDQYGQSELVTKRGTEFVSRAEITPKGPHAGEKVVRFMHDNKEVARAYECCWGRYYNCSRARIGMYCKAVGSAIL